MCPTAKRPFSFLNVILLEICYNDIAIFGLNVSNSRMDIRSHHEAFYDHEKTFIDY